MGLLLSPFAAAASPLKDPQRWVDAQKVDLGPLFEWWGNHSGERPLTAWVHVTGSIVQTNTWGWLLDAHVEKTSTDKGAAEGHGESVKIILKNPPVQELAEFQSLSGRQHALNSQRETLSAKAKEAKNRLQTLAAEEKADRHDHVRPSAAHVAESKKWHQVEKQSEDQLKQVDQQLKELKPKLAAFPNAESYKVDCFAFEKRGEIQQHAGVGPREKRALKSIYDL